MSTGDESTCSSNVDATTVSSGARLCSGGAAERSVGSTRSSSTPSTHASRLSRASGALGGKLDSFDARHEAALGGKRG